MNAEGQAPLHWRLVTHVPPTSPDVKTELTILRELADDEVDEVRAANDLIKRLTAATPYARLVELYEDLSKLLPGSTARRPSLLNEWC